MSIKPLAELPENPLRIKRALLSVSDKTGISELATTLHNQGVELISTGGTAKVLRDAGLPVKDVSELTHFQECLDGRVKTLHPAVHAGILARTSYEPDQKELEKLEIAPIELVVVNLYPFQNTVADPDCTLAKATEFIDIGGPTMVRAAAKNFAHVCILTSPDQYASFGGELEEKSAISYETRFDLSRKAFMHTAAYDTAIANYLNQVDEVTVPENFQVSLPLSSSLRYGENPHQNAAVYGDQTKYIDCFHGKQLSYNNYIDIDSALRIIAEFGNDDPSCVIIKHTIPSGAAIGWTLEEAYNKAFSTDTSSPFGGIVIVNKKLDLNTAEAINKIFTEIIIAPDFDDDTLNLLTKKANRRLIKILQPVSKENRWQFRSIFGGALYQENDNYLTPQSEMKVATKRQPTQQEWDDLLFAWKIVKHVKSNAILFAGNQMTLGIGSGQTSRVDSSEIAVARAGKYGLSLKNSVVASDAYFPFPDGLLAANEAGATAAIQPGGSIRDEMVIEAADKCGMAMVFTSHRHFRH
ncbi:MAG TPA: bifunctional phosphoribosylaminoimidazolecarboxamide formyltransferase/IMP cyclohydrolase [Balneolales bacterium]|nr:bifunctional phosphoribosylaminoimidazolecarboxamide formyltransferase/IMP cyclohydrolase [Balneolales bacterium]